MASGTVLITIKCYTKKKKKIFDRRQRIHMYMGIGIWLWMYKYIYLHICEWLLRRKTEKTAYGVFLQCVTTMRTWMYDSPNSNYNCISNRCSVALLPHIVPWCHAISYVADIFMRLSICCNAYKCRLIALFSKLTLTYMSHLFAYKYNEFLAMLV